MYVYYSILKKLKAILRLSIVRMKKIIQKIYNLADTLVMLIIEQ